MMASIRKQPQWLSRPAVQTIFDVFEKNGDVVYAVGGCVRDAVMGRSNDTPDIDFSTPVTPDRVNDIFVAAGYRTEPTGIEHGTVSVIIDHIAYEVTTYRKDVETDGRRAVVEFTTDPYYDAERRDFTFNALYMDRKGYIFDPWTDGNGSEPNAIDSGITHAHSRKLVFVGRAGERIKEDYLRILRLYRFMATLDCRVDPNALYACAYFRRGLQNISGERIEKETMKLLGAENPVLAVSEMINSEVGVFVFGLGADRYDQKGFAALVNAGPRDAAVRLAYLLFSNGTTSVLDRWKSSTELRRRVLDAQMACLSLPFAGGTRTDVLKADDSDQRVRERMYVHGKQAVIDGAWVMFAMASQDRDGGGKTGAQGYNVEQIERWARLDAPVFPVKGQDLLDIGMKPGPGIGSHLKAIEARWIADNFPDRETCVSWLRAPCPLSGGSEFSPSQ